MASNNELDLRTGLDLNEEGASFVPATADWPTAEDRPLQVAQADTCAPCLPLGLGADVPDLPRRPGLLQGRDDRAMPQCASTAQARPRLPLHGRQVDRIGPAADVALVLERSRRRIARLGQPRKMP